MLKNYLLTALRNILKYRLFSFINIAGLSVGLAAVMLITLYIWDELTFDSYFENSENVYKAELSLPSPSGGMRDISVTGAPLANAFLLDFKDQYIEASTTFFNENRVITIGDLNINEEIHRGSPSLFNIFQLDFIEGDANAPMLDISSVVLSKSTAIRLFGIGPALGRVIQLDDGNSYRVSAVFEDLPRNTHFEINFLFPELNSDLSDPTNMNGWFNIGYNTYVKLKPGVDILNFNAAIPAMIDRYVVSPANDERPSSETYLIRLIQLADVHFKSASRDAGAPLMLMGFAAIALVILSIATFNFMNMSISRTVIRAREVAVRKAVGANRKNIISQFLSETVLTVVLALVIAIVITEAMLPWFNVFASKVMSSGVLISPTFAFGIVGLVLLVALGAGYYPASIMSNFRPADILRGGKSESVGMSRFRTILVTGQFAVAISLMIAATVIYQQIQYSKSMDPGYVKENVLLINDLDHPAVATSVKSLKARILEHPDVVSASLVDQAPGGSWGWITGVSTVAGEPIPPTRLRGMNVDSDFLSTFGMKLSAGRALSEERSSDFSRRLEGDYLPTANVLVNETAVKTLGLGNPEDAIGKHFSDGTDYTVVGVVSDYLIGSSRNAMLPMFYIMDEPGYRLLAIRFKTNDLSALMGFVNDTWTEIAGDRPISVEFLDERIASLYQVEERQGEIFALFASLAVLVSCIGLYGLASFSVAQRTKEIGVRKVFGASIQQILRLFTWQFSKPVVWANLLAWPTAWYFLNDWLTAFTYRVDLNPISFVGPGVLALIIAWITVSGHAFKVARTNPINTLHNE